jgi:hypothetical protein
MYISKEMSCDGHHKLLFGSLLIEQNPKLQLMLCVKLSMPKTTAPCQ